MIIHNLSEAKFLGTLLTIVPAMFYGCTGGNLTEDVYTETVETTINLKQSSPCPTSEGSTLDILVFENDRLMKLDSYQRIDNYDGGTFNTGSTGGEKIFFICADSRRNRYDWCDISSYSSLKGIICNLEQETSSLHTQTGECRTEAGNTSGTVAFRPLVSEIVLDAICCDFSGTPYSGSTMKNVKVYLTNVSASCPLLCSESDKPSRYINEGMLNGYDMKQFHEPGIIYRDVTAELGMTSIYPQIGLLCYQNICPEESPGSPATRLVIEAEVDSEKYYWPVTAGHDGKGIERGCRYVYDIFIRRKGTTDPDTPVNPESIEFNMRAKPWTEKEEYGVTF